MKPTRTQLTLIQIDNYGPWTRTLGNDREHRLQILQAELYASLQKHFAAKDALVFFNRFDEMLAVTNGVTRKEHLEIQEKLLKNFPITISMSIGVGPSPYQAQMRASKLLQMSGSAQSEDRKRVLVSDETLTLDEAYSGIIHVDVDGITELTDHEHAFATSQKLVSAYAALMDLFSHHDSLLFYLGGDNFMGVISEPSEDAIVDKLSNFHLNGLPLKFGTGHASTARRAAELATMNLERIRQQRSCLVSAASRDRR